MIAEFFHYWSIVIQKDTGVLEENLRWKTHALSYYL
jgi:hypothetical protein